MKGKFIGDVLEKRRKEKNRSDSYIAEKTGLSRSIVSSIFQGKRKFDGEEFVGVCLALGLDPIQTYFLCGKAQILELARIRAELLDRDGAARTRKTWDTDMEVAFDSLVASAKRLFFPLAPALMSFLEDLTRAASGEGPETESSSADKKRHARARVPRPRKSPPSSKKDKEVNAGTRAPRPRKSS